MKINENLINAWSAGNPVGAYSSNLFGNQTSFTPDGVLYTYYTYRPDGLRHSIGDKVHVWDGANIVADVDGNDVVVYIRGINLIYADDGDKTYYHFNAHGDMVVLTNASGNKTKSYSYNAFGVEYNESTLDDNPFRYCGEYYDKETKTIYLRARYYNAEQGRFTQQDGWEYANPKDPLSLNLYTYCWNNPIMYIDAEGHDIHLALAAAGKGLIKGGIVAGIEAHIRGLDFGDSVIFVISSSIQNGISEFADKLCEGIPIIDQIVGVLGDALASSIGCLFDQIIDGKSLAEINWTDILDAAIEGAISSVAALFLNEKIAQKASSAILDFMNWLGQVFEDFSEDIGYLKDIVEYISEKFLSEIPVEVAGVVIDYVKEGESV